MAYTTINFAPGLNRDDSPLASEGGWIDGDKVRFVNGRVQTIGGWDIASTDVFAGIARGAHAFADLLGIRYVAFGTDTALYALVGSQIRDITPLHSEGVLTDPFTTTAGSPVVAVSHPGHEFSTGMSIEYPNTVAAVGGVLLTGTYDVTVTSDDAYTITAAINAGSSGAGGGYVDYRAILPAGLVDGTGEPGGYGTGAYGEGGYGGTNIVDFLPRIWFLDSWGETLVALPRGGGLYQWQPALSYPELFGGGTWTYGTGWSALGDGIQGAAGVGSQATYPITVKSGYVYRIEFITSISAGAVTIQADTEGFGEQSLPISVSGTFSRRFRAPAGMTQIVFEKNAAFSGTIDNISITLESVAYRVDEAPHKNAAMFVDPHQFVVLLGTSPYGEPYNAMAVRWCDRQNITDWVPSVTNLAGDDILAQGSRLISGIAARQENAIWSDSCMYTMQYTGSTDTTFNFNLVGTGCGLIGALARCEHNGIVMWAARGDFYRYVGGAPEPILSTLRRDFFDNISTNQAEKIHCGILPAYSEAWFFAPDQRDGNECSRYVTVNWQTGVWSGGSSNRTAWIKPGIYEYPIAFGADGLVYYQEIGHSAAGGELDWFVESAYFDIGEGENLAFLRRIIGDFEDLQGPVQFTVYGRMWPNDTERAYGPFTHNVMTNKIDLRMTARQIKLRVGGMASPAFARFGAIRLDVMPTGMRQ